MAVADDERAAVARLADDGSVTFETPATGAPKMSSLEVALQFGYVSLDDGYIVSLAGMPSRIPPQLLESMLHGKAAAEIGWGTPKDFYRCEAFLAAHGVPKRFHAGECATVHKKALGVWPGQEKAGLEPMTAATKRKPEVVPPTSDPDAPAQDDTRKTYATNPTWGGVLTIEGGESGDGRMFGMGSLEWDTPPLPLLYQPVNAGGHKDSVVVGQITDVRRNGNKIRGRGDIDMASEYGPEAHRLMKERRFNGVSVDVDSVKDADVELVYADGDVAGFAKPEMTIFNRGRIRGATLVAFPAFTKATLELDEDGDVIMTSSAGYLVLDDVTLEFAGAAVNDHPDADFAYIEPGGSHDASGRTTPRSLRHFPIFDADHVRNALARANQSPFGAKAMPKIVAAARRFGITVSDASASTEPLVAASHIIEIPDLPKAHWFDEPTDVQLHGAFTVTDEGRVYGLLAPGKTMHRARGRTVPNGVDYSRFMKGETIVEGGGRVITGPITMDCGHAATENYGTLENRIEHYDNSCSVIADVRVGERADGAVWFGGALKHGVTAEQVSTVMSCVLSGDWQPNRDKPGTTELIAALLVPVPGFPLARAQASVTFEDGMVTASAVPARAATADDRVTIDPAAATLVAAAKEVLAAGLGRDRESRVAELRAMMEV